VCAAVVLPVCIQTSSVICVCVQAEEFANKLPEAELSMAQIQVVSVLVWHYIYGSQFKALSQLTAHSSQLTAVLFRHLTVTVTETVTVTLNVVISRDICLIIATTLQLKLIVRVQVIVAIAKRNSNSLTRSLGASQLARPRLRMCPIFCIPRNPSRWCKCRCTRIYVGLAWSISLHCSSTLVMTPSHH